MGEVYSKQNNDFLIKVTTDFDFERSNPMEFHYLFSYKVHFKSLLQGHCQLVSRKWNIQDATGALKTVEGPGVVGESPEFEFEKEYEYESFCPLPTLKGKMWGYFLFKKDNGENFKVFTPEFFFEVPKKYIDEY